MTNREEIACVICPNESCGKGAKPDAVYCAAQLMFADRVLAALPTMGYVNLAEDQTAPIIDVSKTYKHEDIYDFAAQAVRDDRAKRKKAGFRKVVLND